MSTTLRCINIIYKSIAVLCIRVIVLHGNLYRHTVLLSFAVNDFRVKRFLASVQIAYKFTDTTFIMENFLSFHSFSGIFKRNLQSLCQECHLSQTLFQNVIIIYCFLKYFFIRKEDNCCSGLIRLAVSHNLQRIHSFTAFISLLINLTFMIDPYFKPCGKCIYYRRTYSVKTTGYLVPSASKFTAGMKNGKYYFYSRNPCFMIDSYRNTTSVIYNCDRVVRINNYLNLCTKSCQCFINRIIYNLINQMMKTSAGCTSDIHTWSLSYGFQTFQNLDLIRSVFCIFSAHFFPPVIYTYHQNISENPCVKIIDRFSNIFWYLDIIIQIYYSTKAHRLPQP